MDDLSRTPDHRAQPVRPAPRDEQPRDDAPHVVVVGGPARVDRHEVAVAEAWIADLQDTPSHVIAADSGLELASALGLTVDEVVGDLDSVSVESLAAARLGGATVDRHPADKDRTDLELSLDRALVLGAGRVSAVVGFGGRADHALAGALLLGAGRYAALDLDGVLGTARVAVARPGRIVELAGSAGDLVSLVPLAGGAGGVVTAGLRFPLRTEDLAPGTTRGVSNVMDGPSANVSIGAGVIAVLCPQDPDGRVGTTASVAPLRPIDPP